MGISKRQQINPKWTRPGVKDGDIALDEDHTGLGTTYHLIWCTVLIQPFILFNKIYKHMHSATDFSEFWTSPVWVLHSSCQETSPFSSTESSMRCREIPVLQPSSLTWVFSWLFLKHFLPSPSLPVGHFDISLICLYRSPTSFCDRANGELLGLGCARHRQLWSLLIEAPVAPCYQTLPPIPNTHFYKLNSKQRWFCHPPSLNRWFVTPKTRLFIYYLLLGMPTKLPS